MKDLRVLSPDSGKTLSRWTWEEKLRLEVRLGKDRVVAAPSEFQDDSAEVGGWVMPPILWRRKLRLPEVKGLPHVERFQVS